MLVFNECWTVDAIVCWVLAQDCVEDLLAVDDGSTAKKLGDWAARDARVQSFCHERNRGRGGAVRTMQKHLQAPVAVIQDAYLDYDPEDCGRMLAVGKKYSAVVRVSEGFEGWRDISWLAGNDRSRSCGWLFGGKRLRIAPVPLQSGARQRGLAVRLAVRDGSKITND